MYELSTTDINEIADALHTLGIEATVRTDYSGRAMYGMRCIGIDTTNQHISTVAARVAYTVACGKYGDPKPAYDVVESVLQDLDQKVVSMGMGVIVYWPDLTLLPDEEGVEDGENTD